MIRGRFGLCRGRRRGEFLVVRRAGRESVLQLVETPTNMEECVLCARKNKALWCNKVPRDGVQCSKPSTRVSVP